jgi:hypothetical protein
MPTLAEKRKEWLEVLSGEDRHSIISQITQMTWDDAAFRVINEARRLAPRDPDGGRQLNGLMHSLLDRAFFASHLAAIRRLMDDRYPLNGKKGVYSLPALLKDMRQHRELLTREAIFASEGLEYDYEPIRQKHLEYASKQEKAGKRTYWVPEDLGWRKHERRHERIDQLAGVQAQDRQPGDMVRENIFCKLKQKTEKASKDVVCHVNTFIAHAATPESRALVGADEAGLTLNHLWQAHQHLCEVAGFLAIYVLGDSFRSPLPIPQYDQFKYIERPLIDASQVGKLADLWRQIDKETHGWSQWGLDQYAKEFEGAS